MRRLALAGLAVSVAAGLLSSSCGGGSSAGGSPTSPSTVTTPSGGGSASTIAIVGQNGARSFSPNPVSAGQGAMLVWTNNDRDVHHIVFNDGTLDTGAIAPGASSRPLPLNTDGANYHCTIHPNMVGSINMTTGEPPPCTGIYCD